MPMFSKSNAKSKSLLNGTASRTPLGVMALEPRVLLDAAGFVTAVDAMSDAGADIAVQQAQDAAQALFAAPMTELTDRHAEESDPAYQLIQSLTGPKDIQDTDSVNEDGIKSIVYEPIEDITALNDAPQPEGIPDKSIVYEPFTGEEMEEGAGALAFERSAIDPRFDFADSPDAQAMISRFTAEHYETLSEDTVLDTDDIIDGRAYQSNAGIVFVDTAVADYQDILDGLDPSLEVVLIERGQDGVVVMAETLTGRENIQSVHIISHGRSGNLTLGTATLNTQSMSESYSEHLAVIGEALTRSGDILIYGCDFGGDMDAMQALALATGADIAASSDDTGAASLGGDWELESETGEVETLALSAEGFEGLLAPLTISVTGPPTLMGGGAFNILTSFSAGEAVIWSNAGNVGGTAVDLIATVVSVDPGVHLSFNNNGDDPGVVMLTGVDLGTGPLGSAAGSATVEWSIVVAGTSTALSGTPVFTVSDIDGTGSPFTIETIAPNMENLQTAELAPGSAIDLSTSGGQLFASGTDDDGAGAPGGNLRTSAAVRFTWAETDSWQISYTAERDDDGRLFAHDGDGDFNLGASPTAFVIPQIDLDSDDSSGANNADYDGAYLLGDAGVPIGDAIGGDIDITVGSGVSVTGATITLTNPQAGDSLSVSGLPGGITLDPASTASQIILTGTGTAAEYEAAIAAILFANPIEGGNTDDRTITVEFSETQSFSSNIATATLSVTQPPNDAPDAISDSLSTDEETAISGSVFTANGAGPDSDPNGDSFGVSQVNGAAGNVGAPITGSLGGTFTIDSNGDLDFDPGADFQDLADGEVRHTAVTYQIDDGRGGVDTATVTIAVGGVNDAPIPVDPTNPGVPPADPANYIPAQNGVDSSAITPIPLTDYYADADTNDSVSITIDPADLPAGLLFDGTTISGTPDVNASQGGTGGVYIIPITYDDGNGGSFVTNLTITITNPAPIAQNDDLGTDQNTAIGGSVLASNGNGVDSDPDGDSLNVTLVNGSAANLGIAVAGDMGGNFTMNANGGFIFDPNGEFDDLTVGESRTTSLTYTIDDGEGGTDTATVSVTVAGVNDTPVPVDPANPAVPPADPMNYIPAQSGEDSSAITPLNLVPYFGDADDSDTVTISLDPADLPAGLSFDGSTISGVPSANASQGGAGGTYIIPVTYDDGAGGSFTTNVTITITNPAPIAQNDSLVTNEDTAINGSMFAANGAGIDADPDGDSFSVTEVGGSAANVGAATDGDNGGSFTINPDGTYDFDPDGDFEGLAVGETRVTQITYTIDDGEGGTDTATVSITISGVNDGPIPLDPANPGAPPVDPSAYIPAQTAGDSETVTPLNVAQYFADPDGSDSVILTIDPADLPAGLSFDGTNISGVLSPDASQGGAGEVYIIPVTASDGNGGSFTTNISYTISNPAPVIDTPIGPQTALDNEAVSIPVVISDPDGDTLTYSASGLPAGLSIDMATGVISGTADNSASTGGPLGDGVYAITVTADDGEGGAVDDTFTLTVTNPAPVVDAPIGPQTALDNENISIPAMMSDPDGDTLTYSASGLPAGLSIDPVSGEITGTIDNSASIGGPLGDGVYTVTVTADDGEGGMVDDTFTLTVTNPAPVIDTPIGPQSALDNEAVSIPAFMSDPDGDTLSYSASGLPAGLSINTVTGEITGTVDNSASIGGPLGDGVYTITVTVNDGEGGSVDDSFTMTITNPAPNAQNDSLATDEDTPIAGSVFAANGAGMDADPDGDNFVVSAVNGAPANVGAVTGGDTGGNFTINPDGSYSFDPNGDFEDLAVGEMRITSAAYTIDDGEGGTDTATVSVTVTGVNDAPIAVDPANPATPPADPSAYIPAQTANDGETVTPLNVAQYFADPDGSDSISLLIDPADLPPGLSFDGTTISGALAPDASQGGTNGIYTISVTASDGNGGSFTTYITYGIGNLAPIVDAPIGPQTALDNESISIAAVISDPDGDTLTYSASGLPAGLSIDPVSGDITGTVDNSASIGGPLGDGVYAVTLTADDGEGGTVNDTFTLTVTNPAPIAQDDALAANEDTLITGNVFADNGMGTDADPDGDNFTVSAVNGNPANVGLAIAGDMGGSFTINPDGSYSFDPNGAFEDLAVGETRTTSLTYTIDDGEGGTDTATVSVTVDGVNDAPMPLDPANPAIPPANPFSYIPVQTAVDSAPISPVDLTQFYDDADDSDMVTISLDPADLPLGLTFDGSTISGAPDAQASQGGLSGTYIIPVTYDDGNGGSFTTNLVFTVTNPAPDAQDDSLTTTETAPISGSVFADNGAGMDSDPDRDIFTVAEVNGDAANVGAQVTGDMGGSFTISPDGSYTFDPTGDFEDLGTGESRTTSVSYMIDDGEGGMDMATVSVTVTGENDSPMVSGIIADQSMSDGAKDLSVNTAPAFEDVDDASLTYSLGAGAPAWLQIDSNSGVISIDGSVPPGASQGGTSGDYVVTVIAADPDGETAEVDFTVNVTNLAPIANDDASSGDENAVQSGNVITDALTGDSDAGPDADPLTVSSLSAGALDTPIALTYGTLIMDNSGAWSFTPNALADALAGGESVQEQIVYTVDDGNGGSDDAVLTITVTGNNDAPVPINPADPANPPADPANYIPVQNAVDSAEITPLDLTPFYGDSDDTGAVTISIDSADLPDGLIFDGSTISGTPDAGSSQGGDDGTYIIPVTYDDGNGGSFTTNVTIVIENTVPDAQNDALTADENTVRNGSVFADNGNGPDIDADGDVLMVSEVNGFAANVAAPVIGDNGGSFIIGSDGSYSFDPGQEFDDLAAGETRTTSVIYTIADGDGGTDTASVSVTVTGVNDAPLAGMLSPQTHIDGETITPISIAGGFTDAENDTLIYTAHGLPEGLSLDPDTGQISGVLPSGASMNGPYTVTITATDPDGASVSADFVWTVNNVAPAAMSPFAPVSGVDAGTVSMDTSTHFADPDGDKLVFTAEGLPDGLSIDPDTGMIEGTLTGSASMDGPYEIMVTATDTGGDSVSQMLELLVINPAPQLAALTPIDVIVGEAVALDIAALAGDADNDVLSYSAAGLPDGVTLDAATGLLSGVPIIPSATPYEIVITVSDGQGGEAAGTLLLGVSEDGFVPTQPQTQILPLGSDGLGAERPGIDSGLFGLGREEPDDLALRRIFEAREADQSLSDILALYDYDLRGGMAVAADIPGLENGAQVSVEGVAGETAIFVQLTETISAMTDNTVERWSVSDESGGLPGWIDYAKGGDFFILNRTIADEQVVLSISAQLDNGRIVSGQFEIDMRTGEVELIGDMSA